MSPLFGTSDKQEDFKIASVQQNLSQCKGGSTIIEFCQVVKLAQGVFVTNMATL